MKISHVVQPVEFPRRSDLYIAQPVTLESMVQADYGPTARHESVVTRRPMRAMIAT